MNVIVSESVLLGDAGECTIDELAAWSDLPVEDIADLVEAGVLTPLEQHAQPPRFRLCLVSTVRTARRLQQDFELDRAGLALAVALLRRIENLEASLGQQPLLSR
ncbi:MAG: merR regulatory family protein [Herminiimonas sp.]|nr:merR regulatory family protein [Herminiimonas sp.]MDB5854031.1 merR regulatory family protein [Herminiimonas sp.]